MLTRRNAMRLAASTVAMPFVSTIGWAQAYPNRPVRLIVPAPAGGPADITARIIAQALSERLGQQVVIENRGTAGGNLAAEHVVRSAPDGYTLFSSTITTAVNESLYEKLNFNFLTDLVPVSPVALSSGVLVVRNGFEPSSIPELIAYAKANPGKINQASGGNGSAAHIFGELFKMMADVKMTHVPYRGGGPALTDLLAGVVDLSFIPTNAIIDHVKAGRLRAFGVTAKKRIASLSEIPPIGDFVPGYEADGWQGMSAPKGTPAAIVSRLNREIHAELVDPKVRGRYEELGSTVMTGSPEDFGKFCADEVEKWRKVIKFAGIKSE